MSDDIQDAKDSLDALAVARQTRSQVPSQFSPAAEIESNLLSLLKFRIDRIKGDAEFEDELKQAFRDRLPEVTPGEILDMLRLMKMDANKSVEGVLSPFIAKSDRIPLLDSERAQERLASDEQVFSQANKEVLAGLGEFSKLLSILGKNSSTEATGGGASTTETPAEKK